MFTITIKSIVRMIIKQNFANFAWSTLSFIRKTPEHLVYNFDFNITNKEACKEMKNKSTAGHAFMRHLFFSRPSENHLQLKSKCFLLIKLEIK